MGDLNPSDSNSHPNNLFYALKIISYCISGGYLNFKEGKQVNFNGLQIQCGSKGLHLIIDLVINSIINSKSHT